jgi:hypothetical protein
LENRTTVQQAMHAGIPHHLIDVLDPFGSAAEYSAGEFHDAAHAAVADVLSRARTPLVIGGTGFYLRTFMTGKPGGGKASPEIERRVCDLLRAALAQCAIDLGLERSTVVAAAGTDGRSSTNPLRAARNVSDAAAECASMALEDMMTCITWCHQREHLYESELAHSIFACDAADAKALCMDGM